MTNSNENAFPFLENKFETTKGNIQHFGLTKREYFAGLALQGLLAHYGTGEGIYEKTRRLQRVEESVVIADILIEELNK